MVVAPLLLSMKGPPDMRQLRLRCLGTSLDLPTTPAQITLSDFLEGDLRTPDLAPGEDAVWTVKLVVSTGKRDAKSQAK